MNENKFFNGYPDELAENLKLIDRLGGPDTYEHYPTGWAAATSTPFKMFKRYSEYAGGTCDPLVISLAEGHQGARRGAQPVPPQHRHRADHPRHLRPGDAQGLPRRRAVSALRRVDALHASTRRRRRRRRSGSTTRCSAPARMWEDGWKAVAMHAPISGKGHLDKDVWELYHVDADPRGIEEPGQGAARRSCRRSSRRGSKRPTRTWCCRSTTAPRSSSSTSSVHRTKPPRERYVYYPGTSPVPEGVAVNVRGRSYKILADVEITDPNCSGVIFAHGSRFGGHSLFIKDKKLHYVYNFLGIPPEQQFVGPELKPGKYTLGMEFTREKAGQVPRVHRLDQALRERQGRGGRADARAGRQVHAVGRRLVRRPRQRRRRQPAVQVARARSRAAPSSASASRVEKAQYLDLEKMAAAAFAVD